jgi:hypothetical protein
MSIPLLPVTTQAPSLGVQLQGERGADSGMSVSTRAALLSLNPDTMNPFTGGPLGDNSQVSTRGFASESDGGHAEYYWAAGDTTPDDGVTSLMPGHPDAPPGRWRLLWRDELDARLGGFFPNTPDDAAGADLIWEALRAVVAAGAGRTIKIPVGEFYLPPQIWNGTLSDPTVIYVQPRTKFIGAGEEQTVFYPDLASWNLVSPPPPGTQIGLRWFLVGDHSTFSDMTIDGRRDEIDRDVHGNVAFMPVRTFAEAGAGYNNMGFCQFATFEDLTIRNCYVETRYWSVTAVDLATETLTLDSAVTLGEGDTIKLAGAQATTTLDYDGTTRLWNGTTARIETVSGATVTLADVDFTAIPTPLGRMYDLVERRNLNEIEGFALACPGHKITVRHVSTYDNDGSGISPGGAQTDALLWGQSGVVSMTAATNVIVSKVPHFLRVGDSVTPSGVTGAMVSVSGGGAVSVNGLTGVVATIPSLTSYTLAGWDITVDGTGGFAYAPGPESRQPYGTQVIECYSARNGWQGYTIWRMRGCDLIHCVAENNLRQGFNMEFCREAWYRGGRSTGSLQGNLTAIGYSYDCGFEDIYTAGAGVSEIRVNAANSDVYNGCPTNLMLRNIRSGTVPVRHFYQRVSDNINIGVGVATGWIENCGSEDWITYGYNIRTAGGVRVLSGSNNQDASGMQLKGFKQAQDVPLPPLGFWGPNAGTGLQELSLKTSGSVSDHPVVFTVSNEATCAWQYGILPKAKKYLIEVRWLIPAGQSPYNEFQCRLRRITPTQTNVKWAVASNAPNLAEHWQTQRFIATVPDADLYQDHAIQIVRSSQGAIPGGTTAELHVASVRVWIIDPGPLEFGADLPSRRFADFVDEFGTGNANSQGQLTWNSTNFAGAGGTLSNTTSEIAHPGVLSVNPNTAANNHFGISASQASQQIPLGGPWSMTWNFKPGQVYANGESVRIGAVNTAETLPWVHKLYLERTGANGNFFWVFGDGTGEDRFDTGIALAASWYRPRWRALSPTSIGVKLDTGAEVVYSTNAALSSIATIITHMPTVSPEAFIACDNGGHTGGSYGSRVDLFHLRVWTDR